MWKFLKLILPNMLILLLLLPGCGKGNTDTYHKFPAVQSRLEEFVSGEDTFWDSAAIVYQDENRQGIQFGHNQELLCTVNLQSLNQSLVSGMGLVFRYEDGNPNPEELLSREEVREEIQDLIALLYASRQSDEVFSEWESFCRYWEEPIECEGNRIQWNGSSTEDCLQVKIRRLVPDGPWLLDSVSISTAELKAVQEQETQEIIASYPSYQEYRSVSELKLALSRQDEECYGRGRLEDGTAQVEVWCSPASSIPEKEADFQFHYLPGEVPILYILS